MNQVRLTINPFIEDNDIFINDEPATELFADIMTVPILIWADEIIERLCETINDDFKLCIESMDFDYWLFDALIKKNASTIDITCEHSRIDISKKIQLMDKILQSQGFDIDVISGCLLKVCDRQDIVSTKARECSELVESVDKTEARVVITDDEKELYDNRHNKEQIFLFYRNQEGEKESISIKGYDYPPYTIPVNDNTFKAILSSVIDRFVWVPAIKVGKERLLSTATSLPTDIQQKVRGLDVLGHLIEIDNIPPIPVKGNVPINWNIIGDPNTVGDIRPELKEKDAEENHQAVDLFQRKDGSGRWRWYLFGRNPGKNSLLFFENGKYLCEKEIIVVPVRAIESIRLQGFVDGKLIKEGPKEKYGPSFEPPRVLLGSKLEANISIQPSDFDRENEMISYLAVLVNDEDVSIDRWDEFLDLEKIQKTVENRPILIGRFLLDKIGRFHMVCSTRMKGLEKYLTVQVIPQVTSLTIQKPKRIVTIRVGETSRLKVDIEPIHNKNGDFNIMVSNPDICSCSPIVFENVERYIEIVGLNPGKTTITLSARFGQARDSIEVVVRKAKGRKTVFVQY